MNQSSTLICVSVILVIFFIFLIFGRRCGGEQESFSPYRRTGGCPPRTGWTYLDEYEQQDYYKKYPYIYPTPTNYTKAWYANIRANNKFLEEQRKKMEAVFKSKQKM